MRSTRIYKVGIRRKYRYWLFQSALLYPSDKYSEMDVSGGLGFKSIMWSPSGTFKNWHRYEKTDEQDVRRPIRYFVPAFLSKALDAHEIHDSNSAVRQFLFIA